ncbi:MAG: hypothetical protein OK404_00620 [Thaumarchaeota archaeon]|nr:hypothetical protein [Nitrososphaerota archaeon]
MSPNSSDPEISEEILQEGCFYLAQMGLSNAQIAKHFETTPIAVKKLVQAYSSKLRKGTITAGDFDRAFWEDVKKEAEGDVKLTFLSDKGFHHGWKSELERLDGRALMSIYESSKDFMAADPNQKFLDYPPPSGYDPLAMDREVKKAVTIIGELLAEKWKAEKSSGSSKVSQG